MCGANRLAGKRGVCGAADELRVARSALHFWEEPPISGEAGSGTVFFSHCPLHCIYCQNAGIANGQVGRDITVERLAECYLELQSQGALNINLVTATHYAVQAVAALDRARACGLSIPVVWNTSGYERAELVRALNGTVDVWLTDLRYARPETAKAFSAAPDYPEVARSAIAAMAQSDAQVIVRILALPGHVEEAFENVAWLVNTFGERVTLSMMSQYTPMGAFPQHPELERRVDPDEFEALLDFVDSLGVEEYFWQEGEAALESFIPDFEACEGV